MLVLLKGGGEESRKGMVHVKSYVSVTCAIDGWWINQGMLLVELSR
jgi:hypothetical protein